MLYIGVILIFLFTFLLLIKKEKEAQDKYLILWYGSMGLQILSYNLSKSPIFQEGYPMILLYLRFPILLIYGPLYYFYFKTLKSRKIKVLPGLAHLLPLLLYSLYLVFQIRGSRDYQSLYIRDQLFLDDPVYMASKIWFFVSFPLYLVISKPSFRIRQWEGIFTWGALSLYLTSLLFGLQWQIDLLYLGLSVILSVLIVLGLKIPHVIHDKTGLKRSVPGKKLPDSQELEALKDQLKRHMEERKPYLDRELTFQALSEDCGIPQYLLSHLLNKGFQRNFFDYINQYRVEEFLRLYRRREEGQTIPALAEQAGFSSKPTFYRVFKKLHGVSPAEFFKNSKNDLE